MDTKSVAALLGVSVRRVRAMAASGRVPAQKTPSGWDIEAPHQRTSAGRPLSRDARLALARALTDRMIGGDVTGQLRVRTAARVRALRETDRPDLLLSRWWGGTVPDGRGTAQSVVLRAQDGDTARVRELLSPRREHLTRAGDLASMVASERAIARWTREQLSHEAGIDADDVRRIERGDQASTPIAVTRVLRALGVDYSAIPAMEVPR